MLTERYNKSLRDLSDVDYRLREYQINCVTLEFDMERLVRQVEELRQEIKVIQARFDGKDSQIAELQHRRYIT